MELKTNSLKEWQSDTKSPLHNSITWLLHLLMLLLLVPFESSSFIFLNHEWLWFGPYWLVLACTSFIELQNTRRNTCSAGYIVKQVYTFLTSDSTNTRSVIEPTVIMDNTITIKVVGVLMESFIRQSSNQRNLEEAEYYQRWSTF